MTALSPEQLRDALRKRLVGRGLLVFLSKLYAAASSFRNLLFDRSLFRAERFSIPIISIGNLTAGGNAKTPLTILLANYFTETGRRVVVLSRGYGGSESGPLLVTESHTAAQVGDEPLMLHKKCGFAVVIARARVKGVRHILNRDLGDIILLDDGFQHRWLARDLDILAVNAGSDESIDRFLSGEVLPLGDFRENAQAGMRRAAMLVLSSRREHYVDESVVSRVRAEVPKEMEIFSSKYTPAEAREIGSESVLPKGAVLAFTGIAQPQGFLTTLASMGYEVKEQRCFADHHEFSDTDMQKLRELSQGLPLVCTEKDAVRLESSACNSTGLYYLPITPEIDRAKEFFSFIERSVVKHR